MRIELNLAEYYSTELSLADQLRVRKAGLETGCEMSVEEFWLLALSANLRESKTLAMPVALFN